MLDRSTADTLAAAKTELAAVEFDAPVHAERERIIAEAQATARDIVAEAERAAQDIIANAVKIKSEADRALEAKKKAVCIQKRAQAALALAENIAEGRRLIDAYALISLLRFAFGWIDDGLVSKIVQAARQTFRSRACANRWACHQL